MGALRHGQEGALAPSGNVVKCFCALIVTAKCSADELFMHYFHCQLSASGGGGQPPHLHQYSIPAPLGDFRDVVIDRTIAGDVG